MNKNKPTLKINKKKFIIYFILIYFSAILLLLNTFGVFLIDSQVFFIKTIFRNYFNYDLFIFVPECSGIISLITYLSIISSILISKINKYKLKIITIIKSLILLALYNLFRLILVLEIANYSLTLSKITHFASWFLLFIIILLLIIKDLNIKIKFEN